MLFNFVDGDEFVGDGVDGQTGRSVKTTLSGSVVASKGNTPVTLYDV